MLLLHREPGWEDLAPRLPSAVLSSVNLAEVATKLMEAGASLSAVQEALGALSIEVRDFDSAQAYEVADLRKTTRPRGLSLGDRACLVLGRELGLKVLTADRAWGGLHLGVEIEQAR